MQDVDTVTLQEAMESVGTADAGLFGHSIGRNGRVEPRSRAPRPASRRSTRTCRPTCGRLSRPTCGSM